MPFYPPSSPPLPSASADCCSPARRALLPSFEPTPSKSSSSPSSSRLRTPSRKRARDDEDDAAPGKQLEPPAYPTPAPTSSAALTVSSPTSSVSRALLALGGADINKNTTTTAPSKPAPLSASAAVPVLSSASSSSTTAPSLRAPLSTVALARLPRSGTKVSLGRSSASSTVVLSRTNKLISRVHIVARYLEAHDSIEISCHGWNGARVGTPALEHALAKGERVEIGADTPIIIDVCGERARVEVIDDREAETDALEDDEETDDEIFVNHPAAKLDSPTPTVAPTSTNSTSTTSTKSGPISNAPKRARGPENVGFEVWEDKEEDSAVTKKENVRINDASPLPSTLSENAPESVALSKTVSIPQEQSTDQENSKKQPLQPQQPQQQEPQQQQQQELQQESREPSPEDEQDKLRTHIIAHLAYSRLASTPLSVLRASLPIIEFVPDDKLRSTIKDIACVGVIQRKGKDASGKRLEEQYYYIPEQDDDIHRRAAVEELRGGAGIRSCRKVHKQYFWRKPAVK